MVINLSSKKIEEIKRLYDSGLILEEVGQIIGKSKVAVWRIFKKYGLEASGHRKGKPWKANRILRNGYWYKLAWDHPSVRTQGYVAESRLVIEKHLKRYLRDNERVHHINGIRTDNRLENLRLMSDKKHKSYHAKRRQRTSKGRYIKKGQG